VDLGVFTQTVNRRADIQTSVVNDLDNARSGQSGVSIDEEMTNMVAFERSYQAAAKVISTIDDMLDTLINRMGR
jgi:flagellar hook-associated protein 1 FlgK